MKTRNILLLLTALLFSSTLFSQTASDSAEIKQALYNYGLGWYEGKADLMEKAVYHDFQKRFISVDENGKTKISGNTAMSMYQKTRKRADKPMPHEKAVEKIKEVKILSIYGDTAAAFIRSDSWVDHVLFAKINGEWKMMNVIWQKP